VTILIVIIVQIITIVLIVGVKNVAIIMIMDMMGIYVVDHAQILYVHNVRCVQNIIQNVAIVADVQNTADINILHVNVQLVKQQPGV